MGSSDGLGSVRGVRGLPSSYASSRVAATVPWPHGAAGHGGALRPIRESEVIGPGWTQAESTDHSKPTTDDSKSASCRASIRCWTVGEVVRIAGWLLQGWVSGLVSCLVS